MPTFTGTPGNDELFGSPRADTIDGLAGADLLSAREGNDLVRGGLGRDAIYGDEGSDELRGGEGNDLVSADGSEQPGVGNDVVYGGDGNDRVFGGAAGNESEDDDRVDGGRGDDAVFLDDDGSDRFLGGPGKDVFAFAQDYNYYAEGRDLILDFVRGTDKLQMQELSGDDSSVVYDSFELFAILDSNGDGRLNARDGRADHANEDIEFVVRVRNVTVGGITKPSLVLEQEYYFGLSRADTYEMVLYGVVELTPSDFTNDLPAF